MQSTGQTSTQDLSLTSMQGWAMTWVICAESRFLNELGLGPSATFTACRVRGKEEVAGKAGAPASPARERRRGIALSEGRHGSLPKSDGILALRGDSWTEGDPARPD